MSAVSVLLITRENGNANRLRDSGNCLLARKDAHIISVLDQTVVCTTREVRKRLAIIDERDIEQSLSESRNVGDDVRRIDALEHMVREESADGNSVVLEFNCFAFRNISRHVGKGLVRGRKDRDVRRCCKSIRQTVHEANKLK